MRITIELEVEVKGKLPMVHEIRNVFQDAARQLKYLELEVMREPYVYVDPETD